MLNYPPERPVRAEVCPRERGSDEGDVKRLGHGRIGKLAPTRNVHLIAVIIQPFEVRPMKRMKVDSH